MNQTLRTKPKAMPNDWDRRGLPGWTYHSKALFELERTELFLTHWQIAGHVSDIPAPGDWLTFDILNERALIVRGADGVVRGFHNLCRHRGARLVDGASGHCRSAMVCPFHGWVYDLDGSLRGPSRPETFGELNRADFGLHPAELDIWYGFIFIRFHPGPQGPVATLLEPYGQDFTDYRAEDLLPAFDAGWSATLPVNWKSVRDVDNEGYHVAMAHPALQDLYGRSYSDKFFTNGLQSSYAYFGDTPGRLWSVRNYLKIAPKQDWLPKRLQNAWTYYGVFPNAVIAFTPESAQYYQDIPVSAQETIVTGRLYRRDHESREQKAARYLAYRIDRDTAEEDQMLSIWSNESMQSSAFEDFHLSDMEYGLRNHHDELRNLLPVMREVDDPGEDAVHSRNAALRQR